jgi:two-component system, cell cycle response regulator DivK
MDSSTRSKVVLLVEDNYDNRLVYGSILEHAGYALIEAENGQVGVREAREHLPDLVLMDLSMPVLDGWGALALLKGDDATAEIPVFALTAHVPQTGDLQRARESGFEDYLVKPVLPQDVLRAVADRIGPALPPRS